MARASTSSVPEEGLNLIKVFFSIFFVLSLALNFSFYSKAREQNRVIEVVDGDTFQLKSGKRVRLLGVDAPEYDRCGGSQAKSRLSELIMAKVIKLKEGKTDAYGRRLALVYIKAKLVNKIMLEEGLTRINYAQSSQKDVLNQAFHKAKTEKRGIFSSLCRQEGQPPDSNCLIKANIDKDTYERFYHLPGCSHYNQVVVELDIGEGYFCSEEEAIEAGFKKAAGCP